MIQKFTCVPKSDYDVVIISNGTEAQISAKVSQINNHLSNNEIPVNSRVTYLSNFKSLIAHLHTHTADQRFKGKVVFMFFNGLEFVQDIIGDVIDHYSRFMHMSYQKKKLIEEKLENVYFYFDSSISEESVKPADPYDILLYKQFQSYDYHFNTLATIANDIIKKMDFMLGRIRGVYIDDLNLQGDRTVPIQQIHRNYPKVERIDLSSYSMSMRNDMIF
ncbi:hypothetical protein JA1_000330 [Spathaspora sp. JA1]|nr:hypothetical protein JA1_000330 [Spathaspora sp. JA1]